MGYKKGVIVSKKQQLLSWGCNKIVIVLHSRRHTTEAQCVAPIAREPLAVTWTRQSHARRTVASALRTFPTKNDRKSEDDTYAFLLAPFNARPLRPGAPHPGGSCGCNGPWRNLSTCDVCRTGICRRPAESSGPDSEIAAGSRADEGCPGSDCTGTGTGSEAGPRRSRTRSELHGRTGQSHARRVPRVDGRQSQPPRVGRPGIELSHVHP